MAIKDSKECDVRQISGKIEEIGRKNGRILRQKSTFFTPKIVKTTNH